MSGRYLHKYIYALCALGFTKAVPPDYCLAPLNRSDCGRPPTSVFYYYLPGSRCEIQKWRGCPTMNKFDSEYQCSHYCIYRGSEVKLNFFDLPLDISEECEAKIDTRPCTNESITVYTHIGNGVCSPVEWKGCKTQNKFDNQSLCEMACKPHEDIEITEDVTDDIEQALDGVAEIMDEVDDTIECDIEIVTADCNETATLVYTYTGNGVCSEVEWRGCPTPNKFEDKATCESKCNPNWRELEEMKMESLEHLDEALDHVQTDDNSTQGSNEEDDLYIEEVILLYS